MNADGWFIAVIEAVAASVLLNAGIAKLVSPEPMTVAAAEVVPLLAGRITRSLVHALALAELAVAAGLLLPATRFAATVVTVALGLGFGAFGLLAIRRHSSAPCGCFGRSSRRPAGRSSIGAGLGLAVPAVVALSMWPADGRIPAGGTVVLMAAGSVMLCLWLNRELVVELLWASRSRPAGSEVG
jgi:hypothetical protein